MKARTVAVGIIGILLGTGLGLVVARKTFASPSRIRDPQRDWLAMHVSNAETAVLRSYITLLEQDLWARGLADSMESWTDRQKDGRIKQIWDNNARMVDTQLKQLRESEQEYNKAYPGQHQSDPVFSQIRTVLETGEEQRWTATVRVKWRTGKEHFTWQVEGNNHGALLSAGRRMARFVYGQDVLHKQIPHELRRSFVHVFDAAGEKTITKGPGGRYPQQCGIFIGFGNITYQGGKSADSAPRSTRT